MAICAFLIIWLFNGIINNDNNPGLSFKILIFFILLIPFIVVVATIMDFKIIRIDTKNRIMTRYSIIRPYGKSINLNDYIAKIKVRQATSTNNYSVGYLVDRTMTTRIRINGQFYKNFGEIYNALGLKEVKDFKYGFWRYFVLLYTGRLKIQQTDKNN
jgi:hypothetical protein